MMDRWPRSEMPQGIGGKPITREDGTMAIYSQAYQSHSATQAYDVAEKRAADAYYSTRSKPGQAFWREADAAAEAEYQRRVDAARIVRDDELKAAGLRIDEAYSDQDGYYVDLVAISDL